MKIDNLEIALREDYQEMCLKEGVVFNENKFDEYLDYVFEEMLVTFKKINKERKSDETYN